MKELTNPTYTIKIKIIEKRWSGWRQEGMKIPPTEIIVEKSSGSFLLIAKYDQKLAAVWDEKDQSPETMKRVDYNQKEGFRIFVSPKLPDQVDFTPERTLKPINGEEFPLRHYLPLKKEIIKIGESFEIDPKTMDGGVRYVVTVLEISVKS